MAVLLFVGAPTTVRNFSAGATSTPIGTYVAGFVLGSALLVAILSMFDRPGRLLYRAMVEANPDLHIVPIGSSEDLIGAVKRLTGYPLPSSALPSGAYLIFVDAGRQFELWRWRRGRPDRVLRLPWAAVDSIEIGTVSHMVITDRALILNVQSGERTLRVPLSPQEIKAARLKPVNDDSFEKLLDQMQARIARNRVGADRPGAG